MSCWPPARSFCGTWLSRCTCTSAPGGHVACWCAIYSPLACLELFVSRGMRRVHTCPCLHAWVRTSVHAFTHPCIHMQTGREPPVCVQTWPPRDGLHAATVRPRSLGAHGRSGAEAAPDSDRPRLVHRCHGHLLLHSVLTGGRVHVCVCVCVCVCV